MNSHPRPRQVAAERSARLGAYVAAGVAASMGTPDAEAELIYFDVSPARVIGPNIGESISFGNIDLTAQSYVFGSVGTPSFRLLLEWDSLVFGQGYYGIQFAMRADYAYDTVGARFAYGSTIGSTLTFSDFATGIGVYDGWTAGETAYLGLRMDRGLDGYSYGWARLTFGLELTDPVTISGFAFQSDPNVAVLAGDQGGGPTPVPEPGTMAVGAGLFALAVGAHLRRRREKKAAASDALLNLAAGARGVEKFRADKAA